VHCVSDYCQRLWHMYSSIRSESRRPDVKWHLYILPGDLWVHINAHWRIKGVFANLVKFLYKLGKNWQTRAWDPVFKTAGSTSDAAMNLGLFSQKNVIKKIVVFIRKNCIWMVFVYFAFWGLQEEFSTLPCSPCFT
jgi:hypothetical protein